MVTGTPRAGQTLTSSTGSWTGDPTIVYARQWLRCDAAGGACAAISGATASTYAAAAADVGKAIRVRVTATNSAGSAQAQSAATAAISAQPPANTSAPAITGTVRDGQTLTSTTGTWSGTTPLTYTREWRRCDTAGSSCAAIAGATGTTYALTAADVGSTIRVAVTASNQAGNATATSAATATVTALAPANTAAPAITGTAKEGQLLTASTGTWTGTSPSFAYQWQRCTGTSCAAISGATTSSYRVTATDVTKTIKVQVTASNTAGSATSTSAATAAITTGPPVNTTAPTLSGQTTDGSTLTSQVGTWAGTASITYARQWLRCDATGASCAPVTGVTSPSYVIGGPDVGTRLRVRVTASNSVGSSYTDSGPTGIVAAAPPANATAPTISGVARDGQALSVASGAWTGTNPLSYGYQWRRCDAQGAACADIAGETTSALTLSTSDVGSTLRVTVTASNAGGTTQATSESTAVVEAVAPENATRPSVQGVAARGSELRAVRGEWSGTTPQSYGYQWRRCSPSGDACGDIAGATGQRFSVTDTDVGATLRVRVTATNAAGSQGIDSQATDVVTAPALPDIRLSGTLVDNADNALGTGTYSLNIVAQAAASTQDLRGLRVEIDRENLLELAPACSGNGCVAEHLLTFEPASYADGEHTIDVFAIDGEGHEGSAQLVVRVDREAPATPRDVVIDGEGGATWLAASGVVGSTLLTWSANPELDIAGYLVYRRSAGASLPTLLTAEPVDEPHFTDTTAATGTTYEYTVKAVDTAGTPSAQSLPATIAVGTFPAAGPSGFKAQAGPADVELSWESDEAANGYRVYRRVDGEPAYAATDDLVATDSRHIDETVEDGHFYGYRVRSISQQGRLSAPSTEAVAPGWPAGDAGPRLSLSGTLAGPHDAPLRGGYALNIAASSGTPTAPGPGVTEVTVFLDGNEMQTWTQPCAGGSCPLSSQYVLATSSLNDDAHALEVLVRDARGRVASQRVDFTVDNGPPDQVSGLRGVVRPDGEVSLSWDASSAADVVGYDVLRSLESQGPFTSIVEPGSLLTSTSASDSVPSSLTVVRYEVVAVDSHGGRSNPSSRVVAAPTTPLPAPQGLTANPQGAGAELVWEAVSGASGYLVYRRDGDSDSDLEYELLGEQPIAATSYQDASVIPGDDYLYVVRAITPTQRVSDPSDEVMVAVPHGANQPQLDLSGSLFALRGQPLPLGAHDLVVDATEPHGPGVVHVEVIVDGIVAVRSEGTCGSPGCSRTAQYSLDTLDFEDGIHTVEVVAVDEAGETTVTTFDAVIDNGPPSAVQRFKAQAIGDEAMLSWNPVDEPDLAHYRIYRAEAGGQPAYIAEVGADESAYRDIQLSPGSEYAYGIAAVDGAGNASDITQADRILPGGAASLQPGAVTAAAQIYGVDLAWTPAPQVDLEGYNVYRRYTPEQSFDRLNHAPLTTTEFHDDATAAEARGEYMVRTVDDKGREGPPSASAFAAADYLGTGPTGRATLVDDGDEPGNPDIPWSRLARLTTFDARIGETSRRAVPCGSTTTGCYGTDAPTTVAISPNGNFAAFWQDGHPPVTTADPSGARALVIMNLETGTMRDLCTWSHDLPSTPSCTPSETFLTSSGGIAFTPDGDSVVYGAESVVYSVPATGGSPTPLVSGYVGAHPAATRYPATQVSVGFAADGRLFFAGSTTDDSIASMDACRVWSADADGSDVRQHELPEGAFPCKARPLPGGDGVIAEHEDPDTGRISLATARFGDQEWRALIPADTELGDWGLTSDGTRVLASLWGSDGVGRLYTIGLTERDRTVVPFMTDSPLASVSTAPPVRELSVDGELERATLRSSDTLAVEVSSTATRATVQRLSLVLRGIPVSAAPSAQGEARLERPLTGVAEGRHQAWLIAEAEDGLERSERREVIVDDTPPTIDGIRADEIPGSEQVEVSWNEPQDPALADGSQGAGVDRVRYRYQQQSGGWTPWHVTADESATIPATDFGGGFELEVTDGAGNATFKQVPPWIRKLFPTPTHRDCNVWVPKVELYDRSADAANGNMNRAQPRRVVLEVPTGIVCADFDEFSRIDVRSEIQRRVADDRWVRVGRARSDQLRKSSFPDDYHVRWMTPLAATCDDYTTGKRAYRVRAQLTYRRGGLKADPNAKVRVSPIPRNAVCPSNDTRHQWQADVFKDIAHYSPNPSRTTWKPAPSEWLKTQIPAEPWKPAKTANAWEAHHIVPWGNPRAVGERALLFRCGIHPNALLNGSWQRGFGLKKTRKGGSDNPKYKELERKRPALARRTYHGDTFGPAYFQSLHRRFGGTYSADDYCRENGVEVRSRVVKALKLLAGDLRRGSTGAEKPTS